MSTPEEEGNYTLLITVEKNPYDKFTTTSEIEVIKKRDLSILAPGTVRVKQGEESSVELSIVNTGQADLSDIIVSVEGVPDGYYSLNQKLSYLKTEEKKKVIVKFSIPENASEGTFSGKFRAEYGGNSKEEIFGFTISAKSDEKEENPIEDKNETNPIPIGKIVLPNISIPNIDLLNYILPLSLTAFLGSFLLKKRKVKTNKINDGDEEIKKIFTEIKAGIRPKNKEKN